VRDSLLSALAGVLLTVPARAPSQSAPEALSRRITDLAGAFQAAQQIPGLAVGLVQHGQVVYARGFGVTRLRTIQPITRRTLYHMASVTKTLTAAAILQLVDRRLVELDAPVTRYLPGYSMRDSRYRLITIRQLLSHTAGMPDVTDYRWGHPEYDSDALRRYVAGLRDSSLISAPGQEWHYSNIGFEVLAEVVADVSGESFESYVQRHILSPSGMGHSNLLMTGLRASDLAWGHERRGEAVEPRRVYPYNRPHAGSSTLHADVEDMIRWALVNLGHGQLDGRRLLLAEDYTTLWRPERDITAQMREIYAAAHAQFSYDRCSIALAWFICARHGEELVFHGGEDEGFETFLLLVPARRAAIVVMGNCDDIEIERLALQLLDVLADTPASRK
jgi:CubicO group peptidase (beta-lactamase class C family)